MKVNLSPIAIDVNCEYEKNFAEWYSNNRGMTKDVVMLGYAAFVHGAGRHYQEVYARAQGGAWQEKVSAMEREKRELVESVEEGMRKRLASGEAEIRRLTEEVGELSRRVAVVREHGMRELEEERARMKERTERVEAEYRERLAATQEALKALKAEQRECTDSEVARQMREAAHAREVLCKDHERALVELRARLEREFKEGAAREAAEVGKWRAMYEETRRALEERLDGVVRAGYEGRLAELVRALDERERELAVLKKSNAGKGAMGEAAISKYLREWFTGCEVADVGKVKHSCDIHVRWPDGRFVAVESKYKETITKADVEKFISDVEYLRGTCGGAFRGALFVSVKTRNIPGKGDLFLDFRGGKPLMYVGLSGEEGLDKADGFLKQCVSLLVMMSDYVGGLEKQENDVQEMMRKIAPLLNNIARVRKSMLVVKESNKKILDSVTDMEKEVGEMFERIHGLVGHMDK